MNRSSSFSLLSRQSDRWSRRPGLVFLIFLLLAVASCHAQFANQIVHAQLTRPPEHCQDLTRQTLTRRQAHRLHWQIENDLAQDYADAQILVASTVEHGWTAAEMAQELLNQWDMGSDPHHMGGVLILLVMDQRQIEIAVSDNLAHVLSADWSHNLLYTRIVPYFQKNQYAKGLDQVVQAITLALRDNFPVSPKNSRTHQLRRRRRRKQKFIGSAVIGGAVAYLKRHDWWNHWFGTHKQGPSKTFVDSREENDDDGSPPPSENYIRQRRRGRKYIQTHEPRHWFSLGAATAPKSHHPTVNIRPMFFTTGQRDSAPTSHTSPRSVSSSMSSEQVVEGSTTNASSEPSSSTSSFSSETNEKKSKSTNLRDESEKYSRAGKSPEPKDDPTFAPKGRSSATATKSVLETPLMQSLRSKFAVLENAMPPKNRNPQNEAGSGIKMTRDRGASPKSHRSSGMGGGGASWFSSSVGSTRPNRKAPNASSSSSGWGGGGASWGSLPRPSAKTSSSSWSQSSRSKRSHSKKRESTGKGGGGASW